MRENLSPGPAIINPEVVKSALHKAAKKVGYHQAMAQKARDNGDGKEAADHAIKALQMALIIDHTLLRYSSAWNECYNHAAQEWDRLINPGKESALPGLARN